MAATLAIIAAFLYGLAMIMAQIGLKDTDTFSGALISMIFSFIGSLFLFIYYVPISHFANWGLIYFIIAGLSGPCIGRFLLFIGINRVGGSIASTLYSIKPLFSAIAAVLILGEHLTTGIAAATVIMVGGLAIVSFEESGKKIESSWSKKDLIFPIMAGAAYGLSHVFRKIGLNINHEPLMGVVVQNVTALSFSIILVLFKKNHQKVTVNNRKAWIVFGLSGIFSVLGQLATFHALNIGSVIIVSPLSAISPLFVIVIAGIFLRKVERVTWKIILGAVLIIGGTFMLSFFPGR
jgi:DME family drug/metabolite transporter